MVYQLFNKFRDNCSSDLGTFNIFLGVYYEELIELEKLFELKVFVYAITLNREAQIVWLSQQSTADSYISSTTKDIFPG